MPLLRDLINNVDSNADSHAVIKLLANQTADDKSSAYECGLELEHAAANGRTHIVIALLTHDQTADDKITTEYRGWALEHAAKNGYNDIVIALLAHDQAAGYKIFTESRGKALQHAAVKGHTDIVTALLTHDQTADDKLSAYERDLALLHAAVKGHTDIVTALLTHDQTADDKLSAYERDLALEHAAANGHTTIVTALLTHDQTADDKLSAYDCGKALQSAAVKGHSDIVTALLTHDQTADDKLPAGYRCKALEYALKNGHSGIVTALLQSAESCSMILNYAAVMGHSDVVARLLNDDQTADNKLSADDRGTALEHAAKNGYNDIVIALLAHDQAADYKIFTESRGKALERAAENGHSDIVTALLAHDKTADYKIFIEYRGKALKYAAHNGHSDVVATLLTHDQTADDKLTAYDRGTALARAADNGHSDVVNALLTHDQTADDKLSAEYRGLALETAAADGHSNIVTALLAHNTLSEDKISASDLENAFIIASAKGDNHTQDVIRASIELHQIALSPNLPLKIALHKLANGDTSQFSLLLPDNDQSTDAASKFASVAHSPVTFGVEIEAFGLDKKTLHNICGAITHLLPGAIYTGDGSIASDDNTEGFEIPTGIMHRPDSLARFANFITLLNKLGAKVNESCGLHVHLGTFGDKIATLPSGEKIGPITPDHSWQHGGIEEDAWRSQYQLSVIKQFLINYTAYQKTLNTTLRNGKGFLDKAANFYSKDITVDTDAIKMAKDITALQDLVNPSDSRYHTVNLLTSIKNDNSRDCRTIEIRHHDGAIKTDHIIEWTKFLHGMMDLSIKQVHHLYQLQSRNIPQVMEMTKGMALEGRPIDSHLTACNTSELHALYHHWSQATGRRIAVPLKASDDFYHTIIANYDIKTLGHLLEMDHDPESKNRFLATALSQPPESKGDKFVLKKIIEMLVQKGSALSPENRDRLSDYAKQNNYSHMATATKEKPRHGHGSMVQRYVHPRQAEVVVR